MSTRVIAHVLDIEPFVADVEELPLATATCVHFRNVRTREDKQVRWLSGPTQAVIFAMSRITFIEVPATGIAVEGFVKDQHRER